MKVKIRRARKEDLKKIDEIYVNASKEEVSTQFFGKQLKETLKSFEKHKQDRINGFKKSIKDKKQYFIIALENNLIIGFGQVVLNNKKAKIEKVYVDKNYRRKGVATKIVKKIITWLKKQKVTDVNTGIFVHNKPSIKLHEKLGFKQITINMWRKL